MPIFALVILALIGLALGLPEFGTAVLSVTGLAAGLVLFWQAPKFRIGAAGVLLTALSVTAGAQGLPNWLSQSLYFLGCGLWGWNLVKLEPTARPWRTGAMLLALVAISLLLGIPLAGEEFWRDPLGPLAVLVSLGLVALSTPRLEAALFGTAPEGRVFWGLGLVLVWIGTTLNTILAADRPILVNMILILAYAFLALGGVAETRKIRTGIWSFVLGIGSLELGWVAGIISLSGPQSDLWVAWVWLGALLIFVLALGLVAAYQYQIKRAEVQLKGCLQLIDELTELSRTGPVNLEGSLNELFEKLVEFFPDLVGVRLFSDTPITMGKESRYPYPLLQDGALIGHLYLSGDYQDKHELETLTPLLVRRLHLLVSQLSWRSAALTDPLTGLLNRRGFEVHFLELSIRAKAESKPVAIVLLDLDHFKQINDKYGHPVGDQVLMEVARLIARTLREDDLAVRWGGEEFLLVLYNSTVNTAQLVAQRLRSELAEAPVGPLQLPITFSAGIAGGEIPGRGDLERAIWQADQALLDAKVQGRDQIVIAPPPTVH